MKKFNNTCLQSADVVGESDQTRRPPPHVRTPADRAKDSLSGKRFGNLNVIYQVTGRDVSRSTLWLCKCDCGTEKIISRRAMLSGRTKGCGCRISLPGHRMSYTATYRSWSAMHQRCTNPSVDSYPRYGGRGISVCNRWNNFEAFLSDMGECPVGLTLERQNGNGNYTPKNCVWATWKEQERNRCNNHVITHMGKSKPLSAWAEDAGMPAGTFASRIYLGWTMNRALTQPIDHRKGMAMKQKASVSRENLKQL